MDKMTVKHGEPGYAVHLSKLTKDYDGRRIVDQVSLAMPAGEIFGLLGPNGAGKTTVMKMIAGLTRPTGGTVRIFGVDRAQEPTVVKQLVGLVPQENNLERELTVEEVLLIYGRLFGVQHVSDRVEAVLTEFNLTASRHKKVGLLSGGTARRTLIARALLPEPRLLLLDEPTVGLDPDVRQELWGIVRRLTANGKSVVLTTHYMEEAEQLCRQIAMLKSGRLVLLDTTAGIRRRTEHSGQASGALESLFIKLAREEGGD
ncbi:ABC transporter ATP-binding protein [Sporomusa aerivorans]|uniref:ABC transporter ATP-binding protein n=1 Tax=Sporomusa aerivorans TaxID=204936 RepID=UPI00352ADAC6